MSGVGLFFWSFAMSHFKKSTVVARELGVPYNRLMMWIRNGKLAPPAKDSSGDYIWSASEVEAAKLSLRKSRRPAAHPKPERRELAGVSA